jgi:hypothetical protein
MKAQDFISDKLQALKQPLNLPKFSGQELENEIVRLILSKKYRKFSVSDSVREGVKGAVHECVSQGKPIQAVQIFGGYKLWRLEESPEVDFAELFALMYYAKWLKPVCEIYQPGVWLDFFSDDVIVPIINNVPESDLVKYRQSFRRLIEFIQPYIPKNLKITFSRVGDQYDSQEDFLEELAERKKELAKQFKNGLPSLDDIDTEPVKNVEQYHGAPTSRTAQTVELNVKATAEQKKDKFWREKVLLTHDAYMTMSRRRPYYQVADKFNFLAGFLSGRLVTGSTKNSTMKFWVGIGALRPKGDDYETTVLSSNQLEKADFAFEPVAIKGLSGKNFSKIRIIK